MNTYLLHFTHKGKPQYAWFQAENAGEGVNLIEAIGVDVIETAKIKDEAQVKHVRITFLPLKNKIEYLQTQKEYKNI